GYLATQDGTKSYQSSAKVILTGIGADEQLAGYSRHRVRFQTLGLEALNEEIAMELGRISSRNLGHDDRVIADHGKEARSIGRRSQSSSCFPEVILQEMSCLFFFWYWRSNSGPCAFEVGYRTAELNPQPLRNVFSLMSPCDTVVRAMQFGSRIAKMENNKEKASDKCGRLQVISLENLSFEREIKS
ncbi:asparagine synthetase domain-containing protein 1, partial [Heterocephalus glaber]|uniref:Asparagine synthetase domain-containing protein 1 n=1 Tax=Heterocephalus glaber TaxID=10181 RepID=A0AAX6SBY5_HETGA